jgi:hypothetical protein
MRRKIWIARILLILCVVSLIPGSSNSTSKDRRSEELIYASMKELIRIPLSQISPGSTIKFRAWISESRVGENSAGPRFFQISVREKPSHSREILPWNSNQVRVSVRQDGKELPTKLTNTGFYLESSDSRVPNGLAFNPETRKDCDFELTILGGEFSQSSELIVAPNWPSPMFIKDQIVGAMVEPLFIQAQPRSQWAISALPRQCG